MTRGGHVVALRLAGLDSRCRHAWLVPACLGAAATAYLAWGAWLTAHDPRWLYLSHAWWRAGLRPDQDWPLVVTAALWLAALAGYWWPRRPRQVPMGLITVAGMVMIGAVLGTASLVPCRGGLTDSVVAAWVLGLYVGQPPSAYRTAACPGQPPLALQLGQIVCLGATLVGALTVAAGLWREPADRLRSRFARDATIFTGLDAMTIPLLRRLAATRNPRNIIVIEPDGGDPLIDEAVAAGVRVTIGDPASERMLFPIISGVRGCALSYLYALGQHVPDNEAVLAATRDILRQRQPGPERQPHLVARIDDPRHALSWRGRRIGSSPLWFEDALSAEESTACSLARRVLRTGARRLFLCGDSTLALAILLELARCAWENNELIKAADTGRVIGGGGMPADGSAAGGSAPARLLLERVVLLDPRSADLRREYLATASQSFAEALPAVIAEPVRWDTRLLAALDLMPSSDASESAVIIVDTQSEDSMHEAGRVARLHPDTPVFVLTGESGEGGGSGRSADEAVFDLLYPFQRILLADGEVPEDIWTRVARHWHECFRLRHPVAPGDPRTAIRRPWEELDDFIRQDNILQIRSIMSAVAARGRVWVPVRAIAPGSFIELNECDLEAVARAEHARWFARRLAAGWSADGGATPTVGGRRFNANVVPWAELPADKRAELLDYVRSQLTQLEDIGFVVPAGGPPGSARFQRTGDVWARKLQAPRRWVRRSGEELRGDDGDWRVVDNYGDERTVGDAEFRASHEPLEGERWRRIGRFSAWRVSEPLVIRTKEGRATAHAGDWVVEGFHGERWPVADEQFRRSYRPAGAADVSPAWRRGRFPR